jgi:hypothetical protein
MERLLRAGHRCPIAIDECRVRIPDWRNVGSGADEHWVACHRV